MNIKQRHLFTSGVQPRQVGGPLWFHLARVYIEWVKLGGAGSLLGSSTPPLPPNLPEAATPPLASVEGRDSCSALALERGERGAELLSVQKDFSYVSIRPQRAPNIAQLTSHRRPRLARPRLLHLQAAACGAIIKVRVLFPATLSCFSKCARPIWAIICHESEIAITNNKGFRPPVCCPAGLIGS